MKSNKKNNSGKLIRTIKLNSENHKELHLFKIENDFKTMNDAVKRLLELKDVKETTEIQPPEDGASDNLD